MEGKPNEQGRHSLASNNPNDWRSQLEPDMRRKIILAIVEKLKIYYPTHKLNDLKNTAFSFEGKILGVATDKDDYIRKIRGKLMAFDKKFRTMQSNNVQSGTSVNGTNPPGQAAQAMNQGQPVPTLLPYTQPATSQQWLPQNNILESSGLSTQVSSAAQSLNIQMDSNVLPGSQRHDYGREQLLSQQPKSSNYFQNQMDQLLLKEKACHGNVQPPYMQGHAQQQQPSLIKHPIQQQQPHQTSLSSIQQSFPKYSALSSPSSGQQNSQLLSRHNQFPAQKVHCSHHVPSQEQKRQEREQLFSQLMNGQDTQQNHLTSLQNNGEQHGAFRVSSSQKNDIASFQERPLQNNNIHNMHQQQRLYSHSNTTSALPSQQHQYCFVASQDSTGKTVNASGGDWQEETYQKIKALKEKHILVLSTLFQRLSNKLQEIDSHPEQNIQHSGRIEKLRASNTTLKLVLVFLNVPRSGITSSHRDKFSLYEEHVVRFTKPYRNMTQTGGHQVHVSQSLDNSQHWASSSLSGVTMSHTAMPHSLQTRPKMEPKEERNIMRSSGHVLLPSPRSILQPSTFQQKQFHNLPMQRQQQPPQTNHQHLQMPNPVTPFAPSPHLGGDPENPIFVESPTQEHPLVTLPPEPNAERPIDRLIKAFQSSAPESLAQSISEMSSVISLTDRLAGSVQSIGGSRGGLAEDLSARTRLRLQQGETYPTNKRFKRSITTTPIDITSEKTDSYKQFSSLESEVDSTASSGSKVNKTEPGCVLLQEIKEVNGRLVETVVNICNEDVSPSEVTTGTIVTCSYAPVALCDTFQALYNSGSISQIRPLRLLVPTNYPHSPILLENMPFEASAHKHEDLSARTRSRFGLSMKKFSEPMSLTEIAQAWDACARATIAEYVERHGGGTFSSKYGHWEPVLGA